MGSIWALFGFYCFYTRQAFACCVWLFLQIFAAESGGGDSAEGEMHGGGDMQSACGRYLWCFYSASKSGCHQGMAQHIFEDKTRGLKTYTRFPISFLTLSTSPGREEHIPRPGAYMVAERLLSAQAMVQPRLEARWLSECSSSRSMCRSSDSSIPCKQYMRLLSPNTMVRPTVDVIN